MAVCSEDGFCRFISTMADGKIMNNVADIAKLFTECIRLHCVMALIPTETLMKTKKKHFFEYTPHTHRNWLHLDGSACFTHFHCMHAIESVDYSVVAELQAMGLSRRDGKGLFSWCSMFYCY